jgi:methionyl-tRNA formyltransferase
MIFLVSKNTPWSKKLYSTISREIECKWFSDKSYKDKLRELDPDWIFFFHWSRIVPEDIYKNNRCVVIHTGNLPRARGGSPLQNQILDGIIESKVNAISMEEEVDSGDVYCSLPITLQGTITDIWLSIADRAHNLIKECVRGDLSPKKQIGEVQKYRRNKNNKLPIENTNDLIKIHKFIQMLDGETYPRAFLEIGKFRLEFSRSKLNDTHILSDVLIRKIDE